MTNNDRISWLTQKISELSRNGDDLSRKRASGLSRALTVALETPEETAVRMSFMVSIGLFSCRYLLTTREQPLHVLCARLAIDLKLFQIIAGKGAKVTAAELATESGGEELLIGASHLPHTLCRFAKIIRIVRILRVLSLIGFVEQVGGQEWEASPVTHVMTRPAVEGSHKHLWDMTFVSAAKAPGFIKTRGYKCPTDQRDGIFQFALDTNLTASEFWSSKPDTLADFNNMVTGLRYSQPSWVKWFPVHEQLLKGYQEDTVLLVDVGGALANDLLAFQQKFAPTQGLVL